MYWFDLPKMIVKNISNTQYFYADLYRRTKKYKIPYQVNYLIKKDNCVYKTNDNKYAMFVRWNKGKKFILLLGQNPARSQIINHIPLHVDNTNWNIIKTLKALNYDGYIMVNTFSEIDPNGTNIVKINAQNQNINIFNYIMKSLNINVVHLACTQGNNVALDFINNFTTSNLKFKKFVYGKKTINHFATQYLNKNIKNFDPKLVTITTTNSFSKKHTKNQNNTCDVRF